MVTGTVPFEVTVTDLLIAVPTETLPKAREVVLRLSAGVAAFSCKAKLWEELFEVAVIVAVCVVLTDATLAVKEADDAPDATVTLTGTVTALRLLDKATTWPPDGAAELNDTVHAEVPAPVNELLLHDSALTAEDGSVPVPLRLT
ncbi:MAG TPA: hypothetical protein VGI45_29860 [Terracidiphilus sp.]|jgi:hypothetical protein